MTTPHHDLTLGSLGLTDGRTDLLTGWRVGVHADGFDLGAPSVQTLILELLDAAGESERQIVFEVVLEAADGDALAHGEAALRREVGRRNVLVWTPPHGAAPTAFDVLDSRMQQVFSDLDELASRRVFRVELTCGGWGREVEPTTLAAVQPPGAPTTTLVSDCDSATGWTAARDWVSVPVDATTELGAVMVASQPGVKHLSLTWQNPLPATGERYLIVESNSPFMTDVHAMTDVELLPKVSQAMVESGWLRHVFDLGDQPAARVLIGAHVMDHSWAHFGRLSVRHVWRSNSPYETAQPRERTWIIEPGGTERTPASFHLSAPSSLETAILATWPHDGWSGFDPGLQKWRTTTATRTPDATTFTGNYEPINVTSWVAQVPTEMIPEGGYILCARLRCQTAAAVPILYSTSTLRPGSATQEGFTLRHRTVEFSSGQPWQIVPLGLITLPSVRTRSGLVQVALQAPNATPTVVLDQAWIMPARPGCGLTIVNTSTPNLWTISPDLDDPEPQVRVGASGDTWTHPGSGLVAGRGEHWLWPGGTAAYSAALTSNTSLTATYETRYHTNVPRRLS